MQHALHLLIQHTLFVRFVPFNWSADNDLTAAALYKTIISYKISRDSIHLHCLMCSFANSIDFKTADAHKSVKCAFQRTFQYGNCSSRTQIRCVFVRAPTDVFIHMSINGERIKGVCNSAKYFSFVKGLLIFVEFFFE